MIYAGEHFLPETEDDDDIKTNGDYVASGRNYNLDGTEDYKEDYDDPDVGPSRHFTYLFNTFVLLQLFNEINARRIRDEWNIFEGILKNWLFLAIWIGTMFAQVIMVTFGGFAFSCNLNYGLTFEQWLICIGFGVLSIPWHFVLLLIPASYFKEYGHDEVEASQISGAMLVRRNSQSLQNRHHSSLGRKNSSVRP